MENKTIQAVIFGATGLAGSSVLEECLKHPKVTRITVVTRKSTGMVHDKLTEILHTDFMDFSSIADSLKGHNACFYCLGVSQTKVRDEKSYHRMTYDFTFSAAETLTRIESDQAKNNLVFCFLSGFGSDPTLKSRYMWARIKGKAERDLAQVPFKRLYLFRPGLIQPSHGKKHSLFMTRLTALFYPVLYRCFPSFITSSEEFGLAMINAALFQPSMKIFENKDIREISKN